MESFDKLTAFFREERAHLEARLEQQRQETADKLEHQRCEAKAETAELRRELEEERQERQLAVLQLRLETLHGAKLLDDDTLFLAEDAIADSEDVTADERVSKLVALCAKMSSDRAFARQVKRFLAP